ncbi:hypothetical protein FK523_02485 [Curtobacterium flaccumfaciens pv. flaccumfaciens]|nr:hypothetical protein FK523_02485 [Curtobacterium flaccumfaciens pv. flaccumfaciens]
MTSRSDRTESGGGTAAAGSTAAGGSTAAAGSTAAGGSTAALIRAPPRGRRRPGPPRPRSVRPR